MPLGAVIVKDEHGTQAKKIRPKPRIYNGDTGRFFVFPLDLNLGGFNPEAANGPLGEI